MKCAVTIAVVLFANIAHNAYSELIPRYAALKTVKDDWTPDPLCPYPSEDLTFFPDPDDCSKYYECYEGNKYLVSCPTTMYWDTNTNACQAKASVNCGSRSSTTPGPITSTTPAATSTTPKPSTATPVTTSTPKPSTAPPASTESEGPTPAPTTTTAGPIGTTTWAPDPLCPYPSEDLTFYPNYDNCSQYWECYEGNKYLVTCPNDLVWNDVTSACDAAQNVNCDRKSTTRDPNAPTEAPGDSRCIGQADGSFHSNPDDCSKFYECSGGKAIDEQCPGNTLWNEDILSCDYPTNVKC